MADYMTIHKIEQVDGRLLLWMAKMMYDMGFQLLEYQGNDPATMDPHTAATHAGDYYVFQAKHAWPDGSKWQVLLGIGGADIAGYPNPSSGAWRIWYRASIRGTWDSQSKVFGADDSGWVQPDVDDAIGIDNAEYYITTWDYIDQNSGQQMEGIAVFGRHPETDTIWLLGFFLGRVISLDDPSDWPYPLLLKWGRWDQIDSSRALIASPDGHAWEAARVLLDDSLNGIGKTLAGYPIQKEVLVMNDVRDRTVGLLPLITRGDPSLSDIASGDGKRIIIWNGWGWPL